VTKGSKRTGTKGNGVLRRKIVVGPGALVSVENTTETNAPNERLVFY
jgi:hypothetical protein